MKQLFTAGRVLLIENPSGFQHGLLPRLPVYLLSQVFNLPGMARMTISKKIVLHFLLAIEYLNLKTMKNDLKGEVYAISY